MRFYRLSLKFEKLSCQIPDAWQAASEAGLEKSRRLASRLEPSARKSARSRLYRHRFLQLNSHFAPFLEIYKIATPLHHSKLKISTKIHQTFSHFLVNFPQKSAIFRPFSSNFSPILVKFSRDCARYSRKWSEFLKFQNF